MAERQIFPDPALADDDGLLCVGGDLRVETLVEAYSNGIFPWPQDGAPLLWFSPVRRGVLDFAELHWPRRFLRELKDESYEITFNRAFARVIHECAAIPRTHESGTWILPPIEGAYARFHQAGYAHSVECWRGGELVGGLYGVYVGGVFSGESMFHKESGASKRCLFSLIGKLKSHGLEWMDTQMVTPVLQTFGGKYISRDEFLSRLERSRGNPERLKL
ncbi:MAG: leucyl/phenylalanyl-tRNA--protein transferase [Bdellovibrionota bacterium]